MKEYYVLFSVYDAYGNLIEANTKITITLNISLLNRSEIEKEAEINLEKYYLDKLGKGENGEHPTVEIKRVWKKYKKRRK